MLSVDAAVIAVFLQCVSDGCNAVNVEHADSLETFVIRGFGVFFSVNFHEVEKRFSVFAGHVAHQFNAANRPRPKAVKA